MKKIIILSILLYRLNACHAAMPQEISPEERAKLEALLAQEMKKIQPEKQ